MKKALIFLANGFEEIEALTVFDILTRARIRAELCAIGDEKKVEGAHGLSVNATLLMSEVSDLDEYDILIAPGGMPGSTNLRGDERVVRAFADFYGRKDKLLACICAAGIVLEKAGIASEIAGTCYPSFEERIGYRQYRREPVVADRNVITSAGPATAIYFALKIVESLAGKETAEQLREETLLEFVENTQRGL